MRRQTGIALPQALLLVVLVLGASSLLLQRSQVVQRDGLREHGHLQATQAALGAIAAARVRMRRGDAAPEQVVVGGCVVTLRVLRDGDAWRVRAVAAARPGGHGGPRVQAVQTALIR